MAALARNFSAAFLDDSHIACNVADRSGKILFGTTGAERKLPRYLRQDK